MLRKKWFWVVPAIGALVMLAGWNSRAQEPKTTTEKIKDKVGSAVTSIKKGAQSAEEAIKEQFDRANSAVSNMGVEGRVYARLHWDKALGGAKIDLSAPKKGVIALSGTVADARAKAKAVELTRDTIGVDGVVDNLTVLTTTSPGTAAPTKP